MKTIVLLFFIFCSINLIGQEKLRIEIDNPEPRVGQSVAFSIKVDFLIDYFQNELGENVDFTRSIPIFGVQSDDFKRVIIFKKAGKHIIGPFDFDFNGKQFTTDIIEVNVLPELPVEIGLWLRLIEFEGQKYLILEQYMSNEANRTEYEDGYSHTIGGVIPEGREFAELNKILTKGIELNNYSSSTTTVRPEGAGLFDVGFSYSIKKYRIKFDENFDGIHIISKTDFNNLPHVFDIGRIELKK